MKLKEGWFVFFLIKSSLFSYMVKSTENVSVNYIQHRLSMTAKKQIIKKLFNKPINSFQFHSILIIENIQNLSDVLQKALQLSSEPASN